MRKLFSGLPQHVTKDTWRTHGPFSEFHVNLRGFLHCYALAGSCASINLMPYSVWKSSILPELTQTYMTLWSLQIPDFVVVDFDHRHESLNSRAMFLENKVMALLEDVYEKQDLPSSLAKESHHINLDPNLKFTADYNHRRSTIDVIDML
ncbi:hypothetical protein Tco_0481364 [Tanacetum coccineum]